MPPTQTRSRSALLLLCLAGGFLVRLVPARLTFLNPDEVLHYFLSHQPSLAATYQATLTTAHPPLLILFLHYWQLLGNSEIALRFPSILAGTAFAWVIYLWLKRVSDTSTALTSLVLLLFSPALISISSEVRQYALLLLFAAGSLYSLERAIEENSVAMMLLSALALYLALLTHYSSLIFALTLGIYALARLRTTRTTAAVIAAWVLGQTGALCICGFLYKSHLGKLQHGTLRQEIADTWLRTSVYHPAQDHALVFVVSRTVRLFRYLFSNGTIGVLALLVFLCGITFLMLDRASTVSDRMPTDRKPAPRQLALLLTLPFFITAAAAVAGFYPYGGTRHDVLLATFAMSGVALGLERLEMDRLRIPKDWQRLAIVGVVLAIGNLFPFPTPPSIKSKNQNRELMSRAINTLSRDAPAGSVILTDYEGGLMLSYYLCSNRVVEIETTQAFMRSACGEYRVVASSPDLWAYDAQTLPAALRQVQEKAQQENKTDAETNPWLFQAGWIDDKQAEWIAQLSQFGCRSPQLFGQNIFLCRMAVEK
jgi:4-amino-4-deoxy-L-arabinose transferase-like glycosyltransferase